MSTALPERDAALIARQASADDLLRKPFSAAALLEKLARPAVKDVAPTTTRPADAAEALAVVDPRLVLPTILTDYAFGVWNGQRHIPLYWLSLARRAGYRAGRLAALYGVPSHLNREWRHLFLGTAGRWLHRVRMTLAAYLLWTGSQPGSAAEELNYSDIHHFCRTFHNSFGLAPREYADKARCLNWLECSKRHFHGQKWHCLMAPRVVNYGERSATTANLKLSPQEERVLKLVAAGRDTKTISTLTGLAENTVHFYLKRVSNKLACHSRWESAAKYFGNSCQQEL